MPHPLIGIHHGILYTAQGPKDPWEFDPDEFEPDTLWLAYSWLPRYQNGGEGLALAAAHDGVFHLYNIEAAPWEATKKTFIAVNSQPEYISHILDRHKAEPKYKLLQEAIDSLGILHPTKPAVARLLEHPSRPIRLYTIKKILPCLSKDYVPAKNILSSGL